MAGKNLLACALILLLLLASFGCTSPPPGAASKTGMMGWDLIAGVAVAIMVLLLALSYMAAVFLADDRLKAWVIRELGQVFFSALILVTVIALVGSIDSWLHLLSLAGGTTWQNYVNNGVCCAPGTACASPIGTQSRGRACHIEIASDYLQVLYESTRQSASADLSNYGMFAFLSHLSISKTMVLKFLAGKSTYPFAGLEIAAEFFSLLFDMSIKTMMLLRSQQIFLDFLWYPLFPVMLSMGLVLRIFYFSRKLGGMLVALGLALYVVFPMFYVLANGIMWGFMGNPATLSHVGMTYDSSAATGTPLPLYGSQQIAPQQRAKDVFDPNAPKVEIDICNQSTVQERTDAAAEFDKFGNSWNTFEGGKWYQQFWKFISIGAFSEKGPIANLAFLMVFTVFVPFLALMSSLAAFKVLSPMIGGDVEISLLSRLI
ncbi:MAG: hypothetical protein WC861_05385 [Candidatus Micrarchaeia archaeon]|jgi:hypothetical protein